MFSARFSAAPEGPNPLWAARQAREAAGLPILDLTVSNPTSVGIPYPDTLPSLLARASVPAYRPDPKGDAGARAAVSAYYAARGRAVPPENLVLTASTSEAYAFLFKLLCDPGDEVLIPTPSYPLFDALAELEHVALVPYPLKAGARWRTDFQALRGMISTRCKALILVNPNNPTGHMADAEEIRGYLDLAEGYGLALIVDEVFRDYALGDRAFLPVESAGPLVFTLNGFSKSLGLPQLKLGWIQVAGEPESVRRALAHLEWIADAFLSVNAPVQAAAGELLRLDGAIQTAILSRLHANLGMAESIAARFCAERPGLGRVLRPEAGWSLILEMESAREDEDFALELLDRRGVYVHPGHLFGFASGCRLVVSLLGPEREFRDGLEGIFAHAREDSHA